MGKINRLSVLMNGVPVGHLDRSSKGIVSFGYAQSWLSNDNRRPLSLSLPLTVKVYSGDLVENFFDNLLPDNIALRNRLQARLGANSTRAFDLLSHIGRDCVGAVQLVPEGERPNVKTITADRVYAFPRRFQSWGAGQVIIFPSGVPRFPTPASG